VLNNLRIRTRCCCPGAGRRRHRLPAGRQHVAGAVPVERYRGALQLPHRVDPRPQTDLRPRSPGLRAVPHRVRYGLLSPQEGRAAIDRALAEIDRLWPQYNAAADTEEERRAAAVLRERLDEAGRCSLRSRTWPAGATRWRSSSSWPAGCCPGRGHHDPNDGALAPQHGVGAREARVDPGEYRRGLWLGGLIGLGVLATVLVIGWSWPARSPVHSAA